MRSIIVTFAGQITEELERKIGLMEASLSRFGIVVDSVQSDVMQLNKRTKELSLEGKLSILCMPDECTI